MELVIATPVLLLIVLFIIQAGMWMHATHIAQAAATRAATAAASHNGNASNGNAAGAATLAALGGSVLRDPTVTATRTATDVRVEITGTAATVVPGIRWTVRATAAAKVERFVPAGTP